MNTVNGTVRTRHLAAVGSRRDDFAEELPLHWLGTCSANCEIEVDVAGQTITGKVRRIGKQWLQVQNSLGFLHIANHAIAGLRLVPTQLPETFGVCSCPDCNAEPDPGLLGLVGIQVRVTSNWGASRSGELSAVLADGLVLTCGFSSTIYPYSAIALIESATS